MGCKYGKYCPNCYTEWKITQFNMKTWKDCTKCGLTAEDIVDKKKKPIKKPDSPPKVPKDAEISIDDYIDSMDWDDIFYYFRGV